MRFPALVLALVVALAGALPAATPLTVNVASREEVRQFYRAIYSASEDVSMGWTGNYTTGAPGDTSSLFKEAVLLRINFFRALVGVPAAVTLNSTYSAKDQQAALMMSANSELNHFPPPSWKFYTAEGAEAAGNSNIAIGTTNAGPTAITGYMNDPGSNNAVVGHRRWLIYPQTQEMGTGDVAGDETHFMANAVWVQDSHYSDPRPTTRSPAVPYPPAGYVPYSLVWPRWSFSYPGADFTNATVTMTRNGQPIAAEKGPVSTGLGEPALVWVYDGQDPVAGAAHPRPSADTVYHVTISNVSGAGVPTSFNYDVTVFDPDTAGSDFTPVTVAGSATPTLGNSNPYAAAKPSFAGSFEWRLVQLSPFAKTYNGTAGLDGITASTSAGYSPVVSGVAGASGASYHLAHPTFTTQSLTLPETFLVGASASVEFASRLSWATPTQIAHVQVSTDDGASWVDVYTQAGTGTQGENSFTNRSAPLAAFSGRTIRVRFTYTVSGSGYLQSDTTVGWFLDNITLNGVQMTIPGAGNNVGNGTSFSFIPASTNAVGLQARGVLFGAYPLEWGPLTQVSAPAAASFTTQPGPQAPATGGSASFTAGATNNATYQWQLNGTNVDGATTASYTINNVQPVATGIYTARATTTSGTATSQGAILGVNSGVKLVGPGEEFPNITATNGNVYDQILMQSSAASMTADPGQILRVSFLDLSDDIVQVEFSGAGTLSVVLDNVSGPMLPSKYNQSTLYMKGHARIVLTGANVTTNLSVFSVGRSTAVNQLLFRDDVTYDGFADIAFVAITSTDGKFGGLRTANASYFATKGLTGVYAPGVEFTGPVHVGEIRAADDATPVYIIGGGATTNINGGDLLQTNGRAVQISGVSHLNFIAGSTSHGVLLSAQRNHARLEQNGADVTATITVNP